jgi:putative membrane protein
MRKTAVAVLALATGASLVVAASSAARPHIAAPELSERAALLQALDDPTIVAIFDAANTADMETGALAAERGNSKEVRDFGSMLVNDHRQVRQLGRDLAKKLGVTPTPPKDDQSAKQHAATMTRLRGLDGKAFDVAFLQYEAEFHASVIDAVKKTLLPAIKNAELKALVEKVAPAFQGHMLMAQNLEKKLTSAATRR